MDEHHILKDEKSDDDKLMKEFQFSHQFKHSIEGKVSYKVL
jgi:hypothetical protein